MQDDLNDESLDSKKLHEEEVTANMLLFMISGYDSVSTALASCTYVLATKSDIQEKLQTEIDNQEWNNNNQLNYDILMNMTYIHLFILEVLRMYPIAISATKRECNMTTTVYGHQIEKGYSFLGYKSFLNIFFSSFIKVLLFNQIFSVSTIIVIYGDQKIQIFSYLNVIK